MATVPLWRRPHTWISGIMLLLGIAACAVLWVRLGSEEVRNALVSLARYIPILFTFEAGRLLAEMTATKLVLRSAGAPPIPFLTMLRGQCLAHGCNKLLPTGRMVGEAMKAAIFSPTIGPAKAIGVGGAVQIMTILSNGTAALAAALITFFGLDATREASLFFFYSLITLTIGGGVLVSLRNDRLTNLLCRFRTIASIQHRLAEFAQSGSAFGVAAFSCHFLGKVARMMQYAVMLAVLGQGVHIQLAVVAESVQILGGAAGELIPAQVGAVEGALVLAAPLLGLSGSEALSMGLIVHGTQLLFAGFALFVSLVLRLFNGR